MENLQKLINRCKAGISIEINTHKDYYETVDGRLDEMKLTFASFELDLEIRKIMVERDTIVDITFSPDTPVGSYNILHYDIEEAIKEALKILTTSEEARAKHLADCFEKEKQKHPYLKEGDFVKNPYGSGAIEIIKNNDGLLCLKGYKRLYEVNVVLTKLL